MATFVYEMVGMRHRGSEQLIAGMPKGQVLRLVRDPGNKFDPNAVAIYHRQKHIAFVKASEVADLARRMDQREWREAPCSFTHVGSIPHVEVEV